MRETALISRGTSLLFRISLLALASCSADELADRKHACADYVKFEVLSQEDRSQCIGDEQTFKAAADKIATRMAENVYPILTETARRTAASVSRVNHDVYSELSGDVDSISASLDGKGLPPHFYVDIEQVTFTPPTDKGDSPRSAWQIGGSRRNIAQDAWTLDISGIGPHDFEQANEVCSMLAYSSALPGCSARVFVEAEPGSISQMPELKVMAIKFAPPTIDQAREIFLESEMSRWPPRPAS
ncbi:hypothetical protein [Neorhizobium sp. LjRoot104]|uniref:hypothetical protein n=1 Tax=Neorhizobium sp. LjRoot104 TaxID=3342254 RepID=UPI003ECE0E7E